MTGSGDFDDMEDCAPSSGQLCPNLPHSSRQIRNEHSMASTSGAQHLVQQSTAAVNLASVPRARQYNEAAKSPYVVFIRELETKLSPIKLCSYINQRYTSTELAKRSPGQLKVILKSREEAKALVLDEILHEFHVSIPADRVEVEGAIDWFDLCDLTDLKLLSLEGLGGFNNDALPPCKIVHAERLSRRVESATSIVASSREFSNTVKVVFEGQVLPQHVNIMGLRVRVRPFFKKPMFCNRCLMFGHTMKFCRRKQKCVTCAADHPSSECPSSDRQQCPFCDNGQQHDRNQCQFFSEVTECFQLKEAHRRKTRLDQAVSAASRATGPADSATIRSRNSAANPKGILMDDAQFPALSNVFTSLPVEDESAADVSKPNKVKNPYAQAVKDSIRQQPRFARKRRRNDINENPQQSTTSNNNLNQQQQTAAASRAAQSITPKPAVSALKGAIIAFAKQAGVADIWISLLEAIIEPLLKAILPQLPSLLGALNLSVPSRQP